MTPKRFELIKNTLSKRQPDLSVIADGVHKTHNIAAITRTCDAVGILDIYAIAPNEGFPQHHATAGGVNRWTRLHLSSDIESTCRSLRAQGFQLLAAHQAPESIDFRSIDYCQPTAVIFGTELDGVSDNAQQCSDQLIHIPMTGMVESLNVSVAAAVVLYEAQKQRQQAGLYTRSRLDQPTFDAILFEWCYPDIARRCRRLKVPYPRLSDHGEILSNPFTN